MNFEMLWGSACAAYELLELREVFEDMNDASADRAAGVVLPLTADSSTEQMDALEVLARGRGLLITPQDPSEATGRKTDAVLSASSALGRHLTDIAGQFPQASSLATASGATLFRLELPSGSTLRDLVQASGGGYRGLVRASEGTKIAGQVRLLPAGAGEGGAVVGGLAAGPAIALIVVAVGAEALARYQLEKKLDAIRDAVRDLQKSEMEWQVAILDSAEEALHFGAASLLDQITIPDSIGLGPSRNNLRVSLSVRQWRRCPPPRRRRRGSTGCSDVSRQVWRECQTRRLSSLTRTTRSSRCFELRTDRFGSSSCLGTAHCAVPAGPGWAASAGPRTGAAGPQATGRSDRSAASE